LIIIPKHVNIPKLLKHLEDICQECAQSAVKDIPRQSSAATPCELP